ncbi:MAG: nuclear transport factor 2 family protein [Bacteroidota bacterium]|nr:nuclear transport factor 2 family protein [Bacteroidota bacterium]
MIIYSESELEVMETHQILWQAYAERDIDRRFSVCSENITFIGTGLHERAVNKADYRAVIDKTFPNFLLNLCQVPCV